MDARDRGGGTDRSKCKPGACRIVRIRLSHLTKTVSRISATIGQVKTSSKLLHHLDGSAKAAGRISAHRGRDIVNTVDYNDT